MAPITHGLLSWIGANLVRLNRRERGIAVLAGIIPDLDGLGIFFGLKYYIQYHHVIFHNFLAGFLVMGLAFAFSTRRIATALLAGALFHLHLLCDLLGSGPVWPLYYLWPLSQKEWLLSFQWNLASWQNTVVTILSLIATVYIAVRMDRTPVEFFSTALDQKVVGVFKNWFGGKRKD
ncbi:MAG: metal-dependent hydrolase [bacterium]|nr:metal-dependent hydrolase [bacterium]